MKKRLCRSIFARISSLFIVGMLLAIPACGEPPTGRDNQPEGNAMRDLPEPRQHGEKSLEETMAGRRSIRAFRDRALNDEELSQLLWAAQGITDTRRGFRTAPSAGATFPLEIYAVTANGIHRYHPDGHKLEQMATDDRRAALAVAALGQDSVRTAPLIMVFCAVPERTTRRYGDRGEMFVHMEVGHAAQNIHLQAVALKLGSVPIGAFDPDRVADVVRIPAAETVMYLVPVGEPR